VAWLFFNLVAVLSLYVCVCECVYGYFMALLISDVVSCKLKTCFCFF